MRFFLAAVSAALAASTTAAPAVSHVVHERRSHLSPAWSAKIRADGGTVVPVRIGMTQNSLERGHDLLMEVSEHDSPKYGKHYTQEEIHDIFAPSAETVDALRGWLEHAGIAKDRVSESYNKQWLQFDSAVEELESLLKAEFYVYEHDRQKGKHHLACEEYSVPEHVAHHIDYITPGIKLVRSSGKQSAENNLEKRGNYKLPIFSRPLPADLTPAIAGQSSGDLSDCESVISPACISALYNITANKNPAMDRQLGIFEDLGDHYAQEDLNNFFEGVYPTIPQGTHPILNGIDGATGPIEPVSVAGAESDLDFQISYPIIWPSNSILFQTDDDVTENDYVYEGFLNNFFDAIDGSYCTFEAFGASVPSPLDPPYPDPKKGGYKGQLQCGKYTPTKVISISYGGAEADLPYKYQKRQCAEIMKLGMQGISVLVATGDYGVSNYPGDPSPNGCLPRSAKVNGTIFAPGFPDSCPYITNVGSTYLPPGGDVKKDEEVATTRFGSAGGFSNIYPIPTYQQKDVQGYLTKYPPPYPSYATFNKSDVGRNGGVYNRIGRAYPDVAGIGDNVLIWNAGRPRLIGGTSAAAPMFSSILARINMERINAGKSTVGFVNPTLYANPDVLHDITVGDNPGCGTNGFSATPGWDPVTGLGTPNYPAMLKLFMGLP